MSPQGLLAALDYGVTCAPNQWMIRADQERWPSGLRRTLGKRVYSKRVTRVRIPVSPQQKQPAFSRWLFHGLETTVLHRVVVEMAQFFTQVNL